MTVTVVTGASSGMGRALAVRLAARGETVALLARRTQLLEEVAARINASAGRALPVTCDVTDPQAVERSFARIRSELGEVDRLIICAGGGTPSFVDRLSSTEVAACMQLNFIGAVHCIEAVLPAMRARGSGHLVAIGSLAGYRGLPTAAAYSASKAALANFMESLRIDLRGSGVDVTLLLPGFVRSKPGNAKKPGKPLRLSLEQATNSMEQAIVKRQARLAFPWLMALALGIMRTLPAALYDRLLQGRGRKPPASP